MVPIVVGLLILHTWRIIINIVAHTHSDAYGTRRYIFGENEEMEQPFNTHNDNKKALYYNFIYIYIHSHIRQVLYIYKNTFKIAYQIHIVK